MNAHPNTARSLPPRQSVPEALPDGELLAQTRRLVGQSNLLLAELLAHLAEVERRGIHRMRACSSLYTYCIYELRLSEDEAFRRVTAARLVKRFPALLDAVASGELHLTGLLLLGPHLTDANLLEVLARAKHRTKREIAALVRVLDPLPSVPARIEPLGPASARVVLNPATWDAFGQALCPIRELTPGDRPRDWTDELPEKPVVAAGTEASNPTTTHAEVADVHAGAPSELAPHRYAVQFTATDEYVRLVSEAQSLLSHVAPKATLAEIQLRALRTFVTSLKKQKHGLAKAANPSNGSDGPRELIHPERVRAQPNHVVSSGVGPKPTRAQTFESEPSRSRPPNDDRELDSEGCSDSQTSPISDAGEPPRQRGRHIPAAIRRAVFARDEGRCAFLADNGRRCSETHRLEFHHLKPFSIGGAHRAENLSLRCRAHNALAAEVDFGRSFIDAKRTSAVHEPFVRQRTPE